MERREFGKMLALGAAAGLALPGVSPRAITQTPYDIASMGNVHLLHMTDAHAQLMPMSLPRTQREYWYSRRAKPQPSSWWVRLYWSATRLHQIPGMPTPTRYLDYHAAAH